jgi:hypothetical protein
MTNVDRITRLAPAKARALADGPQARPAGVAERRQRGDGQRRQDRGRERHDIGRIRAGDTDSREQQAADRRPDHRRDLEVELAKGDRGR